MEAATPQGVAVRISDGDVNQHRAMHEGAALVAASNCGLPGQLLFRQHMLRPLTGHGQLPAGQWAKLPSTDPFLKSVPVKHRDAAMASLAAAR